MISANKAFSIGIDVGGTNTDAVIIEHPSKRIVNFIKTATSNNFTTGVLRSIRKVLKHQSEVTEHHICALMLGTTTFLNAVIQESADLSKVIAIRLCGVLSRSYHPFCSGFPATLRKRLESQVHYLSGGFEFNKNLISKLNEQEIRDLALKIISNHKSSSEPITISLTGIHSPLYNEQELEAARIMEEEFQKANVKYYLTMSHKVGLCGLIERENATILNACLRPMAQKIISTLREEVSILKLSNLGNNIFFTENDGTLLSYQTAMEYPIFTFNSGPINSLRGAYQLSCIKNGFVCDIGGTTTDIAVIQNGFPRASSTHAEFANVRTNFRTTDTVSIGLGGGSLVEFIDENRVKIGPTSIGNELTVQSQCFGGKVLTPTDMAVKKGLKLQKADSEKVNLNEKQLELIQKEIINKIETVIDKMKTSSEDVPLILVGGGSILVPNDANIVGVSKIVKPQTYFGVANAMGAAIAQVSATIEHYYNFQTDNRTDALAAAREKALEAVLKRGAIKDTIEYFPEEVHLSYGAGNSVRVIMKAVGDLDILKFAENMKNLDDKSTIASVKIPKPKASFKPFTNTEDEVFTKLKFADPKIIINEHGIKEWHLTEEDIEFMAIGAGILGSGGGGSPILGKFQAIKTLRSGKTMKIISPNDIKEGQPTFWCAHYGAPAMMIERLGSESSLTRSVLRMTKISGAKLEDIVISPVEIGGMNSLAAMCVSADLSVPIADGDFMGRAFPQLQMITPLIYGENPTPSVMSDDKGIQFTLDEMQDNDPKAAEDWFRTNAVAIGCDASLVGPLQTKKHVEKYMIKNTLSQIWRLGKSIMKARKEKSDPLSVIEKVENGKKIFMGKIVDCYRRPDGGYNKGKILISGFEEYKGSFLYIDFQNENLIADLLTQDEGEIILGNKKENLEEGKQKSSKKLGRTVAITPDLISLVNNETYQPILCEELRYGLRCSVLVLPGHPLLRTEQALNVVGPKGFGYDVEYVPVGDYKEPLSVFVEYGKKN